MKRVQITLTAAMFITTFFTYSSDLKANDEGLYIVPSVAYNFLDVDGDIEDLPSIGLNLGYQWDQQWAFELGVRAGATESKFGDDADMLSLQADVLYNFQPLGNWQPYVVGSLMELSFDVDKTRYETLTGLGGGMYYRLSDNIRLRSDARVYYSFTNQLADGAITLGIEFTFGGSKAKYTSQPIKQKTPISKQTTPTGKQVALATTPQNYTFEMHFDTGSVTVLPEYKDHVSTLITELNDNPNAHITIEGDTDNTGGQALNLHLSEERAMSVKQVLVSDYGIKADRISLDAKGYSNPIADNSTAKGRAKNRRAVVKITITH